VETFIDNIFPIFCLICITPVVLYCFYSGYLKENKQRVHTIAFWFWLNFLIVFVINITNLRQYKFFNIASWLLAMVGSALFVILVREITILKMSKGDVMFHKYVDSFIFDERILI